MAPSSVTSTIWAAARREADTPSRAAEIPGGKYAAASPRSCSFCPRCGYDLRGEIATWRDACPMHGKCTECGLVFDWMSIFRAASHPWLFEYNWRRNFFGSWNSTALRSMLPRSFWRDTLLTHRIHFRAALGSLLIPLFILAVMRLLSNAIAIQNWRAGEFTLSVPLRVIELAVPGWVNGARAPVSIWLEMAAGFLPALFTISYILPPLFFWPVVFPLLFILTPVTISRAHVRPAHLARITIYSLLPPLVLLAAWATASFVITGFDYDNQYTLFTMGSGGLAQPFPDRMVAESLAMFASMGMWTILWWSAAASKYLRLPAARRVIIGFSVIATLSGLVLATLLIGPLFFLSIYL